MPLVNRADGYPLGQTVVNGAEVQSLSVSATGQVPPVIHQGVTHSQKDRSIVRQVSWKIAGHAMANWTGGPDAWFEKCLEIRARIEKDILEA